MSKSRRRHLLTFSAIAGLIIACTIGLIYIGPEQLVAYIRVQNGYLLLFFVSLFGGVSSIGGAFYVATIISLAAAGLNPFYLALASGCGVSIGDSVYYYLGYRGSHVLPESGWLTNHIRNFGTWLSKQTRYLRGAAIYGYTAFTPLPNDALTILMGITRQPYLLVLPAFVLGNITQTFLLATLGDWLPF